MLAAGPNTGRWVAPVNTCNRKSCC